MSTPIEQVIFVRNISTHNISFDGEIWKLSVPYHQIPSLSVAAVK